MNLHAIEQVSDLLSEFVDRFAGPLGRCDRWHWCKLYLSGLLLDGDRKSIEPLARRVRGGNVQAMQQFVNQSPWDHRDLLAELRRFVALKLRLHGGVLILDDVSLPKKGKNSVGVAHQYCGALGKTSNCQSIVTWHLANAHFHIPLAAQLYVPRVWADDPLRMQAAGVPPENQEFSEKWRIALRLLDELGDDVRFECATFDADYGRNRLLLAELDARGVKFVGQTSCDETFWDGDVPVDESGRHKSGRGSPRSYPHVADRRRRPKSTKEWAEALFADSRNVRHVTLPLAKGGRATYVAKLVFETRRPQPLAIGAPRWLLIERLDDGAFKYYVSNYDERASPRKLLLMARERWKVEQGYQQLKEELGLDHFEGRSWRGLHHHIALTFMAYDFLQLMRRRRGKSATDDKLAEHEAGDQRARQAPAMSGL